MTRAAGKTALILGERDIADLRWALTFLIDEERDGTDDDDPEALNRLYALLGRLNDASRRLERWRDGRSVAAK